MNFSLFFQASLAIQLHVYFALFALVLGGAMLWIRKGTKRHKQAGRIWVAAMVSVALSSFAIHEGRVIGPFSPIHFLSVGTLVALYYSIRSIRQKRVKQHASTMKWLYFAGLITPGLFTLLPGRLLHQVAVEPVLNASSDLGMQSMQVTLFVAIILFAVTATALLLMVRRRKQKL